MVEGPTLADRIAQGPVPLDEALPIAKQIAEALEAAHDAGVIHRDLKPANIKLRPDGTVKVLDFGLAKALAPDPSSAAPGLVSQSPTITSPAMTRAGVILGTAAYMSPEQARGDVADRRSDIWAFGCVLFEMLTGRRAFEGETVSDTLAGVLRAEPDWHRLPRNLHARLRLLLERCLEKNVRNRYHGVADARMDVQQVLVDPHGGLLTHASDARSIAPRRLLPWLAATALLTGLIVGIGAWTLSTPVPRLEGRLTHVLPDDQSFTGARHPLVAVAPDGSSIVYVANNRLFLRPIDELEARPIRGTEGEPSTPVLRAGWTVGRVLEQRRRRAQEDRHRRGDADRAGPCHDRSRRELGSRRHHSVRQGRRHLDRPSGGRTGKTGRSTGVRGSLPTDPASRSRSSTAKRCTSGS